MDTIPLLLRRLERTPGNLFQPVIVEDEARVNAIISALMAPGVFAGGADGAAFILKLGDAVRSGLFKTPRIIVWVWGPLSSRDLDACNRGRDCIAGAGVPVIWLMSRAQRRQLQGCPDLWSVRGMELYDGLETCPEPL